MLPGKARHPIPIQSRYENRPVFSSKSNLSTAARAAFAIWKDAFDSWLKEYTVPLPSTFRVAPRQFQYVAVRRAA